VKWLAIRRSWPENGCSGGGSWRKLAYGVCEEAMAWRAISYRNIIGWLAMAYGSGYLISMQSAIINTRKRKLTVFIVGY
jgi:hypothetical protein